MNYLQTNENLYRHFWIIPDVHGCSKTLATLIESIDLQPTDALVFLGDLINRGPDSAKVLDIVQEIQSNVSFFCALLGNHEEQFLQNRDLGKNNLRSTKKMTKQAINFFKKMPRYLLLESAICVHAGFNFQLKKPFEDLHSMCWIRTFEPDPLKTNFRAVVHGHSPTSLNSIQTKIQNFEWKIPLDNGCVFKSKEGMGNLLAYELHSRELLVFPNEEFS